MQAEVINRRLVKFVWAAAIFFAWTVIQGAVQEMVPAVRALTEQGPGGMLTGVHTHMGLMGWMFSGANGSHLLHRAHHQWQVHRLAKAHRLDILDFCCLRCIRLCLTTNRRCSR